MASMNMNNNWLGFSLSPHQEIPSQPQDHHHHHHQHNNSQSTTTTNSSATVVPRLGFINSEELISSAAAEDQCFDHLITSDDSTLIPSLNLPAPFSILEAFNRTNQSHDWDVKDVNIMNSVVVGETLENQEPPKLENFLGQPNNNTTIGLSMIKNWLRNNPSSTNTTPPSTTDNNFENNNNVVNVGTNNNNINIGTFLPTSSTSNNISTAQNLSLSMSTGSDIGDGGGGGGGGGSGGGGCGGGGESYSTSDTKQSSSSSGMETVPRKSIDTFGQRTSIYRGVTRHRWTGRYEAHLWDNSCRREGQTRKGRQVYLGGYDKEEKAARAYDLAALKYWGTTTTTNFPISNYEKELEEMKHMTRQEYVASLRRKSSGFSRGASIYRGVTRHHQHGRWQARIGRVAGNKDLYLGTFSTQEEAAEAYDIAAIKFRGLNAVTNFEISRYDVKSILESSTLPIGGAAKRLKDAHEMAAEAQRTTAATTNIIDHQRHQPRHHDNNNLLLVGSHLTDGIGCNVNYGWPSSLAFHQQSAGHPYHHYPNYATHHHQQQQQRVIWCKQEQDNSDDHHHHGSLQDTHNFLLQQQQQPSSGGGGGSGSTSVLHNLMSLDSSSLDHNPASNSNSVIYSINGGGHGYGNNIGGGFHLPIGNQNQDQNGFLDHDQDQELKEQQQEMGYGNLYYYQQQQQQQLSAMATGMPTRSSVNVAVCHGPASTFTVWNE